MPEYLVADGVRLADPFIDGSEILTENSVHVRDVEPPCSEHLLNVHLLNVRPVLMRVVKGLERG
jgi:hypothetical protein